jgi:membrane-associated PAP2 superfamily phosphatase
MLCGSNQTHRTPLGQYVALSALVLVLGALAMETTSADLTTADMLYKESGNSSALRDLWWMKELLHDGGQTLVKPGAVVAGSICLASLLTLAVRPFARTCTYLFLVNVLSAFLSSVGKKYSNVAGPWDLERYGSDKRYVTLFAARPVGTPQGRCFPESHSSRGFALLALYYVARARRWRYPGAWLALGAAPVLPLR